MDIKDITKNFKYKVAIPIRFSDMDMFGHANNAVYLTYFEQARSCYWSDIIKWDWKKIGIIVAKAEINYVKPIVLEEQIFAYVKTSRLGNSSWEIEYALVCANDDGTESIRTQGKTVQVAINYQTGKPTPIPPKERALMKSYDNIWLNEV
ncbi:acyl-CoA thioesterase [Pedobacter sp. SD-b]|uniref:Acyl-CoA thioesterase n=1 Tax=Pedobacter segetis TaxID=2793069 RepID=A0ABS1BKS1_9SPHI|nr:thioesterase family protein [Pedobacter segetis]MBK0383446.1 acyl-CoA thioesterase [Pedobacter segetis]